MEALIQIHLEVRFEDRENILLFCGGRKNEWHLMTRSHEIYSPSRRREAPCEGTNSPRLFTPGETKALAKSKVHQWSRALSSAEVSMSFTWRLLWGVLTAKPSDVANLNSVVPNCCFIRTEFKRAQQNLRLQDRI
jgi:hypothetical protein